MLAIIIILIMVALLRMVGMLLMVKLLNLTVGVLDWSWNQC